MNGDRRTSNPERRTSNGERRTSNLEPRTRTGISIESNAANTIPDSPHRPCRAILQNRPATCRHRGVESLALHDSAPARSSSLWPGSRRPARRGDGSQPQRRRMRHPSSRLRGQVSSLWASDSRRPGRAAAAARAGRAARHGARRLQRSAGAQRLSAGDPQAGRPLDRLHRPSRRRSRSTRSPASRKTTAPRSSTSPIRSSRNISRTFPASRAGRGRRRADGAGVQRQRNCRAPTRARSTCCAPLGNTGHEIWDVTDPAKPARLTVVVSGLRGTHKSWWECDTGIAYLVSGAPGWRTDA